MATILDDKKNDKKAEALEMNEESEAHELTDLEKSKVSYSFAKDKGVVIASLKPNIAHVVCKKGTDISIFSELRRHVARPIEIEEVDDKKFNEILVKSYESDNSETQQMMRSIEDDLDLNLLSQELPSTQDLLASENDAPIIKLINGILSCGIKRNASDIHMEVYEKKLIVRYRIDGVLTIVLEPPRALASIIISRIKVMAKLDIAEKRIPQDGRIALFIAGHEVDIRVSTLPTQHGERIVMRILDKKSEKFDLISLGMSDSALKKLNKLIKNPYGIILVTGPTGSGKSTSLYAMLTVLNTEDRNILTVEDPIEYYLPGVGQTQVNTKVNMTFAKGLRAILRQDPDIVMVGEIRDLETVETSIQASLTGHLVLSTLHTNTAIGAITRLRDMGVESFLLSSTMIGVLAQRLVRILCNDCKKKIKALKDEKDFLGFNEDKELEIYKPVGCDKCNKTGFKGRTGIYDLVAIDEKLRSMITSNDSEMMMEKYIRKTTPTMREDGVRKVLLGITTIEEVMRVTTEEL